MLFPHPAGPVTSQIWCPFSSGRLLDVVPLVTVPLERDGAGSRTLFCAEGILWREAGMVPEGEGACPLTDTGVSYESMMGVRINEVGWQCLLAWKWGDKITKNAKL